MTPIELDDFDVPESVPTEIRAPRQSGQSMSDDLKLGAVYALKAGGNPSKVAQLFNMKKSALLALYGEHMLPSWRAR